MSGHRPATAPRAHSHGSIPMSTDTPAARRDKAFHLHPSTNLRAVQILLGHTKIKSTVRYLGVDIEDALALAEGTEV